MESNNYGTFVVSDHSPVLVSWVAVNNDPYERERATAQYRLVQNQPVPGPTLTLLYDQASPYAGRIHDVVLFSGNAPTASREYRALTETLDSLRSHDPEINITVEQWDGEDPTDHRGIFTFLSQRMPILRQRFAGRELVIHISPGTPSMQTIWVLMGETGFIEPPVQLVKSYRKEERYGRAAVVPVSLGIDTFYKAYRRSRPAQVSAEEQGILWDPARFRTNRMRQLFAEARRYAQLNVPVLLLGERGTGKTTLASWIRMNSPFRREEQDAHWPAVACGQYSPETMRAELFGYLKGSFTGATRDTEGLLAAANGDTLFLDEVGDISPDLQRLLIKAVEEKQYLPLGNDRPKHSNFRLITATNLESDELRRRLHPDFLDRISLLVLQLPALRDISEELRWLWPDVYRQAAQRCGVTEATLHSEDWPDQQVINSLARHPLPGNLRDLFRVAYRILSARHDPVEPLKWTEAVDYGLEGLDSPSPCGSGASPKPAVASQAIARAFAETQPLDHLLQQLGRLDTGRIEKDLKAFLARELRRCARTYQKPINELCDVSERTLRTWVLDEPNRKDVADHRQINSESVA
ncbi:putative Sigma54 specific transcriptional regulator, Fis family protein [Candidatus Competibacter denitrificans Run_A_D11]|uniref:Sigma54 specific transcriptional regulator, Fis family protein n=1 Tax=Candidatus Competibacter denitrificans Run_A_D11 TaxID=1400863 RepID=W6MAE4_9GAMM|nr:putative Sigma54 specific transcriptional regulator, Fis family protein [Candidatus Competibacter denitrificans Run_A_D11]